MPATKTKPKRRTKTKPQPKPKAEALEAATQRIQAELEREEAEAHHEASHEIEYEVPVYAWPSKSRCPRCDSLQTLAKGYDKQTRRMQYRECQVPICGITYKVVGTRV